MPQPATQEPPGEQPPQAQQGTSTGDEELTVEERACVRLSLARGVGPRIFHRLIEHFGSAAEAAEASLRQLAEVEGVGPQVATAVVETRNGEAADRVLEHCRVNGVRVVTCRHTELPPLLRQLPDCPPVLYVRGRFEPADELSLAIVGTRHASVYGRQVSETFARGLARAGLTIVSGLARGIDALAQTAALEVGGRTIAVLGSNVTDVYPPENAELADRIAQGHGVVCSETPPFAKIKPGVFPQRNRLISGLSLGVLVVEAAEKSGSLITASHAGEQGRDVFAVPGSILSRTSRGCNRLIRDGAILAQGPEDILEHLGPLFQTAAAADDRQIRHPAELLLNPIETAVLQAIGQSPTDVDAVVAGSGLAVPQVLSTLSVLEMRRLIRRTSPRSVQRV